MSLSQVITEDRDIQRTPRVPSKDYVQLPMDRLSFDKNVLLKCKFHVPVDESNWTYPVLMKEAILVNQDFDAFVKLTNPKKMKCAKRVLDSYLYQVENSMGQSHDMEFQDIWNYQHFCNISHPCDTFTGTFPAIKIRKELLDVFDEMDFHEAYKSIIDIEQSLVTNKRKQVVDENEVFVLDEDEVSVQRIHWFMALAVSNLIMQYGRDQKNNVSSDCELNVFSVLRWKLFQTPFSDDEPLEDTQMDTLLKTNYSNGYSLLCIEDMKDRALTLYEKVNHEKGFSLENALVEAENRDLLLSLYRLSSIYYAIEPGYFSNTLENYPLFWQIYAELKGRIVIASDYGHSKFFVPFGFERVLMNCLSRKVLQSGEICYSAEILAKSSIGVESFFCCVFQSSLKKDESSQVFCPSIKKITARSLELCKKDFGEPNDNKALDNNKVSKNEACTKEEDSSSKNEDDSSCNEDGSTNDKALENDKAEDSKYSFFLRLV